MNSIGSTTRGAPLLLVLSLSLSTLSFFPLCPPLSYPAERLHTSFLHHISPPSHTHTQGNLIHILENVLVSTHMKLKGKWWKKKNTWTPFLLFFHFIIPFISLPLKAYSSQTNILGTCLNKMIHGEKDFKGLDQKVLSITTVNNELNNYVIASVLPNPHSFPPRVLYHSPLPILITTTTLCFVYGHGMPQYGSEGRGGGCHRSFLSGKWTSRE